MITKLVVAAASAGVLVAATSAVAQAVPTARSFTNCTQMHKTYAHGVGKRGAHDKVSGSSEPVTNFKRSTALYRANKKSDRDGDGVACEAH